MKFLRCDTLPVLSAPVLRAPNRPSLRNLRSEALLFVPRGGMVKVRESRHRPASGAPTGFGVLATNPLDCRGTHVFKLLVCPADHVRGDA